MNEKPRAPDPKLLAEHLPLVERLARRLVLDPNAADDVVQETLLAAMKNPPRRSWRGWLARVVRNLAYRSLRSDERRRRREHRAAVRPPESSGFPLGVDARAARFPGQVRPASVPFVVRALLAFLCFANAAAAADDLATLVWKAADAPDAEFAAALDALNAHPRAKPHVVAALLARGPDYGKRTPPRAYEPDAAKLGAYALTLPWRDGAVQRFDCRNRPEYWYEVALPARTGGGRVPVYVDLGLGLRAPAGFATVTPNWTLMQALQTHGRPMSMTAGAGFQSFLLTILADLERRFPVDRDRTFLGGYSRGGNSVWFYGTHRPDLWAGIVPVSGYFQCDRALLDNLKGVAIFAAHGADRGHRAANEFTRRLAAQLRTRKFDVEVLAARPRGVDAPFPERVTAWMERPRRDPLPRRVRFAAAGPQFHSAYWVEIAETRGTRLRDLSILGAGGNVQERIKLYQRPPSIDVEITGPNEVTIRAKRVAAVRLHLSARRFDLQRPLAVQVGARRLTIKPNASVATLLTHYRRDRDGRRLFPATVVVRLAR
ncbi:MAG: hypothetical protein OER88_06300 [Planctomycetota bacterium]|nr:hypothetical protein [Planctomycetota bacterium]